MSDTPPHDLKQTLAKLAAQEEPAPFGGFNVSGSINLSNLWVTDIVYTIPKTTSYATDGWIYKPISTP